MHAAEKFSNQTNDMLKSPARPRPEERPAGAAERLPPVRANPNEITNLINHSSPMPSRGGSAKAAGPASEGLRSAAMAFSVGALMNLDQKACKLFCLI